MHDEVEAGGSAEGAFHAVSGDVDVDDGGVYCGEGFVVDAEGFGGVGPVVGDDAVGHFDDFGECVLAAFVFEVEGDALHAAVEW